MLLKSTGNLYGQLDASWCALPRPDLTAGFAQDPRFAGLLDERDMMHGFIAHVKAGRDEIDGAQVYLELVLDDGSCLFRPLTVTPFATGERLPQLLRGLSAAEPELSRIIDGHLAPFLASVRPASSLPRRGGGPRAIPLGEASTGRSVSAIMPFRTFAELQPILALLAGTPEAEALELTLLTSRDTASELGDRLGEAFAFYGLERRPRHRGGGRIAGGAARPRRRGISRRAAALLGAMRDPQGTGLARAALRGDGRPLGARTALPCAHLRGWLDLLRRRHRPAGRLAAARRSRGRSKPAPPKSRSSSRAVLQRAGGLAGHLFGDAHAHAGLAERAAAQRLRHLVLGNGRILDARRPGDRSRADRADVAPDRRGLAGPPTRPPEADRAA